MCMFIHSLSMESCNQMQIHVLSIGRGRRIGQGEQENELVSYMYMYIPLHDLLCIHNEHIQIHVHIRYMYNVHV